MKRIILLICAVLFIQLGQAVSETISCESIHVMYRGNENPKNTCIMGDMDATIIDSDDFSISPRDSTVLGLLFQYNRMVSFLPIKVDETFPNLQQYSADGCSLKTVFKINFKNLTQLQFLSLSRNEIEIIYSNTFEDLTSLEVLYLDSNKIKQMNGAVFGGLNELKYLYLVGNICINNNYRNATAIANVVREVNENCKFTEPESSLIPTIEQRNRTESLTSENRKLSIEVATLKTQLATAENLNLQSEVTIQKLSNEVAAMKKQLHGLVSNGLTS